MDGQTLPLLVPDRPRSLRERAGLSQKVLSARARVGPSRLCSLERGRLTLTDHALLLRLTEALQLAQEARDELALDAQHDIAIASLAAAGMDADAICLTSNLWCLTRTLSRDEQRGLASHFNRLKESKRLLAATFQPSKPVREYA